MATVVNSDELVIILTSYGLARVAQVLEDRTINLNLAKIKVGDANGEYYTPIESMEELRSPIPNGSFYVIEKQLLEDGQTISFKTVFPESFGGYDIREVGLYEVVDGEDKLFAIGVQQPLVKPDPQYNYMISVDYYLFLKSANLADIYDNIVLDPDDQIATMEDLEELMLSMLFTQGNLSKQIGQTSHIIGLNRPTEVYNSVVSTRDTFGYLGACQSYSTFANRVGIDNVLSYWVFNYPRSNMTEGSITDIGPNQYNLSTNVGINLIGRRYVGVASLLEFPSPNYYFVDSEIPFSLLNEEGTEDLPFTMAFIVQPNDVTQKRTLLGQSDYSVGAHIFEVNEVPGGILEIKLFTDSSNFATYTSLSNSVPNSVHSVIISYDNDTLDIIAYINGKKVPLNRRETGTYTHMATPTITLYGFKFNSYQQIFADSDSEPTKLLLSDGSPYDGVGWTIHGTEVRYEGNTATYESSANTQTDQMYAWSYDDGVYKYTIYTKTENLSGSTLLYNKDYSVYTGSYFTIEKVNSVYIIQYGVNSTERDTDEDLEPETLYAYRVYIEEEHIWANSNSEPTMLYKEDGTAYTGGVWTIIGTDIAYADQGIATYDSSLNTTGKRTLIASFVINSSGQPSQFVNSNVGLIAVATNNLTESEVRAMSLELESALGKSPCITPR